MHDDTDVVDVSAPAVVAGAPTAQEEQPPRPQSVAAVVGGILILRPWAFREAAARP